MRIVEATVDDSSISNFLDGIGQIAPLPFTVAGHGKCGQEKWQMSRGIWTKRQIHLI
jgi:hypothetical protein